MRGEVDTSRLEAFSDGVFAISITLLIVGVGIKAEGGSLAYRLAEQWPGYASYVVSFATIGILWLHHHEIFRDIRVADHGLFLLNLLFLLGVCFIPFPTKVMGDELASPDFADQRTQGTPESHQGGGHSVGRYPEPHAAGTGPHQYLGIVGSIRRLL